VCKGVIALDILSMITDKNDKIAYENTKMIAKESELSDKYYEYLNDFSKLLKSEKSHIRIRAFILCASQSRWDHKGKIKEILPDMVLLFCDDKPTVVRQCLNAVKEIIAYRKELTNIILDGINQIELSKYNDSMRPLIEKDIFEVLKLI